MSNEVRAAPTAPPGRPSVGQVLARGLAVLALGAALGWLILGVVGDRTPQPGPGSVEDTGPPLAADESYVETRVFGNGDVVVRHWIRTAEPIDRLRLAPPKVPGAADLSADWVVVVADGSWVVGPERITGPGATYTFDATTDVRLSYRLTGATERSDTAEGRALVVATSLDVELAPSTQRETRVVRAAEVLSLACAEPAGSLVPCGESDARDQWRVELTGRRVADRVAAQVNLG